MPSRYPPTSLRLPPGILRRVDRLRATIEPEEGALSRSAMLLRVILAGCRALERRYLYRHPLPSGSLPEPGDGDVPEDVPEEEGNA